MSDLTISDQVSIGGCVKRPLSFDADAFGERADRRTLAFQVVCTFDGAHGAARPMEGVPLCALIREAEPAFEQRTDFKRIVIVAESVEGYRALFSWNELFNTVIGDGVAVAWPQGRPAGPYALVSLHDQATGPRYVQRLASVTLQKVW